jgi:hypothetical protein
MERKTMTTITSIHLNGTNGTAHAASEATADSVQVWAERVIEAHRGTVGAVINEGRVLIAAKKALQGTFLRMFRAYGGPVPYSVSKAERLMKIAGHPILSDSAHGPNLPSGWRTLYALTRVPDVILLAALADGRIHPEIERADAESLADPGIVQQFLDQVGGLIDKETMNWGADRLNQVAEFLCAKAEEVRRRVQRLPGDGERQLAELAAASTWFRATAAAQEDARLRSRHPHSNGSGA